jgi:O-antigen biosynthesis protein
MKKLLDKVKNKFRYGKTFVYKAKRFYMKHGTIMTIKRVLSVIISGGKNLGTELDENSDQGIFKNLSSHTTDPIQILFSEANTLRLNLVTDSIGADTLFGGVATALILANEFAKKNNCELRIITRNSVAQPEQFYNLLDLNGLKPAKKVTFYNDVLRNSQQFVYKLEVGINDVFLATSWWSAKAISETNIRERFFYLIQEVETFFYPYGIDHFLATQIFESKHIDFIVNSKYLFRYFEKHNKNIADNGIYFEPAFSNEVFYPQKNRSDNSTPKHKLFFYARPNHPRNLYSYGLNILNSAITLGIIDTNQWEIIFAGQDTPKVIFDNGYHPIQLNRLSFAEYAVFIRGCDLAFSLMYTPHPSYPPLDFAASGGVVLTNTFECKEEMNESSNIILSTLDEKTMFSKLSQAIQLSLNYEQRSANFESNKIERDWAKTLQSVIDYMEARI